MEQRTLQYPRNLPASTKAKAQGFVVDATPEVFLPATHRKCSFPGEQLISADRVLYKDNELVGTIIQSLSQWSSQQASQPVQQTAIELHHKLHVTVFVLYSSR